MGYANRYHVRLVGGPFEGDAAEIDGPLPPKIWVTSCPRCHTHWYDQPGAGALYRKDEVEDNMAVYIFTDESLSGDSGAAREGKGRTKRELTKV